MPTTPTINSGDTAWLLTSAALVMLMTPALGFFYGARTQEERPVDMMHSRFALALISVKWVLWATTRLQPDTGLGIISGLSWVG
jgi:Amt family ammonium transporter